MGRLVRCCSLVAVCLLFFSPTLPADGAHGFTDRAGSFSDHSIDFTHTDLASVGGDSALFVSKTLGSNEDHLKGLDDSEDHPGKAWGWYKKDHHHHHEGAGGWNVADQDNEDTDGDSGSAGSIRGRDPSPSGVPEPSTLILLSMALAALWLKSLRRATA
jgi:hypothetical protein